ncbi:AKH_1a_G0000400.mRNA.1.CDS.1 [Saccharomyces cerevisiae]|nr:AKH_1a_G0000400.mRNA.1.CDS.1 [Saccharomyces cerevisiae]CAI6468910.1 AKH_1a_G0000400.mRNA.1.CDS.1 [Saccharomyces cerevisiae]
MQNAQIKSSSKDSGIDGTGRNSKDGVEKRPLEDVKQMIDAGTPDVGHKSTVETKPNVGWQASHSNLAALHEKEQKYEMEHHHARHKLHRQVIPDYTSASTAMFSDCMFNAAPDKVRSLSTMKSSGLSPKHPFNVVATFKGPFPQHSVESKPLDGGYSAKDHFPSFKMLQAQQHPAHRHYKDNDKYGLKSPSRSFVKDKKRLVHRFLKSMEPSSSGQSKDSSTLAPAFDPILPNVVSKPSKLPTHHSHSSDGSSSTQTDISLQSLLYHDLESSPKKHVSPSRPPSVASESSPAVANPNGLSPKDACNASFSQSSSSSLSSSSSSSSSTSFSQSVAVDPLEPPGNITYSSSNLSLNSDELDYYQRHIGLQLQQTEALLKHSLKDEVLKDENDLVKNIANFDKIVKELRDLRSRTIGWKELVEEDYLMNLKQDFDKENPESFEARLSDAINTNVAKLQDLEKRMASCKDRLASRKEVMRKMESLLSLENSLMISKKNVTFASKYRNEALDIVFLIIIIVICYTFKHLISHK